MDLRQKRRQKLKDKTRSSQKAFTKYRIHPKAPYWTSEKSAEIHLKELVTDLDFEGKSVLDAGCGLGNVIPHISRKAKKFDYTGVDIVPKFIQAAQKKYPNTDLF